MANISGQSDRSEGREPLQGHFGPKRSSAKLDGSHFGAASRFSFAGLRLTQRPPRSVESARNIAAAVGQSKKAMQRTSIEWRVLVSGRLVS
jgi:hypothetical protein